MATIKDSISEMLYWAKECKKSPNWSTCNAYYKLWELKTVYPEAWKEAVKLDKTGILKKVNYKNR